MSYQKTNSLVDGVMRFKISDSTVVLFQKAVREAVKLAGIVTQYADKLDQRSLDAANIFIRFQSNESAAQLLDAFGSLNLVGKIKGAGRLVELLQVIVKFYSQIEVIAEAQDYFKDRVKLLKNAYRPGRS